MPPSTSKLRPPFSLVKTQRIAHVKESIADANGWIGQTNEAKSATVSLSASYVGFTTEEVKVICKQRGLRFEGMKEWYDDETREALIPNKELLDKFKTSIKTSDWTST